MGLGPQGLREGCELRDAKPFPADIRGEAADPDSLLDVLFRVQAGQGGGEAVGQGLSALAGAGRGVIRRTAEVTLGAGIKQEGGTSKSSSGAVWYWQKTEKAP